MSDEMSGETSETGMRLVYAGPSDFKGFFGCASCCYLRIWRGRGQPPRRAGD